MPLRPWLAAPLAALPLFSNQALSQTTGALSTTPAGTTGDGASLMVAVSGDARWAVFQSAASDLVAGDVNASEDIFRRDLWTGEVVLVSVAHDGGPADGDSRQPQVSGDGRLVVFQSFATNLVPGDTNGVGDVFVRDLALGNTERLTVADDGTQSSLGSRYPFISRDGRRVVFESSAPELVPGDVNGRKDVFVRDLELGTIELASAAVGGGSANGDSMSPAISPDGLFVAFSSEASDLVAADANGCMDVFVRDLVSGKTLRASTSPAGVEGNGRSAQPGLSAGGRFVSFQSEAANLSAGDVNGVGDVFVKDLATGAVVLASVSTSGAPGDWHSYSSRITPDGRFLAFYSQASTLVAGDVNGRPDAFVRDLVLGTTVRASVGTFSQGSTCDSRYPVIGDDGRYVAFEACSDTLVAGDTNGTWDVFLRDLVGSFHALCADDGAQSLPCPCANPGGPGRGCASSTGGGAMLTAVGVAAADLVTLSANGLTGEVALLVQSAGALADPAPFGDGVRCVAAPLLRLDVAPISAGLATMPGPGETALRARSALLGDPIAAGSSRFYQVLYRDPQPAFCTPEAWNASSALRIDW